MRTVTFILTSLLVSFAAAPAAHAADVSAKTNAGWVTVAALPGEANRLTASATDNVITVADAGADLVAGDGCEQVGAREVRCTVVDAAKVRVEATLGDLDDEATALGALPVKLAGGDGNDRLTGGAGKDDLDGGEGDDVLAARDGIREDVICGGGADSGEADPEDEVAADCEGVAKPLAPPALDEVQPATAPQPAPGKSFAGAVKAGTVLARVPGVAGYAPVDPSRPLPVGTVVDTTNGTLTLTAAATSAGATQTADFTGGKFVVAQTPAATMTTELRLTGGDFSRCPRATARGAVARTAATRPVRKLWGSGKGRFRTRGRSSAATVRGTVWQVVDRCDGTLTRVTRGVVAVKNLRTKRTRLVRAGQSVFVRHRAR